MRFIKRSEFFDNSIRFPIFLISYGNERTISFLRLLRRMAISCIRLTERVDYKKKMFSPRGFTGIRSAVKVATMSGHVALDAKRVAANVAIERFLAWKQKDLKKQFSIHFFSRFNYCQILIVKLD
jgi:hypothetical protein